ncbi:MAG: hypothetical protein IM638_20060 [Bacteroidetes bacterium]|nr:hypothetical protein [Bacteroidota bacterium]
MGYTKLDVLYKIQIEFPHEVKCCKIAVFQIYKDQLCSQICERFNLFTSLGKHQQAHVLSEILIKLNSFSPIVFVANANPVNLDLSGYVFYVSADLNELVFESWKPEQHYIDWIQQTSTNSPGLS